MGAVSTACYPELAVGGSRHVGGHGRQMSPLQTELTTTHVSQPDLVPRNESLGGKKVIFPQETENQDSVNY